MNHPVTTWVGAIITLTVLSYLIKDNLFYRLAQKVAMGTGLGIAVVLTWQQVLAPYWWVPIRDALRGTDQAGVALADRSGLLWLLVLIPGALWYAQMSKKWFRLSKPVIGLFLGVAAGLAFKSQILLMLPQLGAALKPLNPWRLPGGLPWDHFWLNRNLWTVINNAVFLLALFTTLLYFCFTIRSDNRLLKAPMKAGRLTIMITLGAMFGNAAMTRMSFLIERIQFLFQFVADQFHLLFS